MNSFSLANEDERELQFILKSENKSLGKSSVNKEEERTQEI